MRGATDLRKTGRDLDRQVTLQVPTIVSERTGSGVVIPGSEQTTYTDVTVKAERLEAPGREGTDDNLLSDTRFCRWVIAYRSNVNSDYRVVDEEGTVWNVHGVSEMGKRAFTSLTCSAQPEA